MPRSKTSPEQEAEIVSLYQDGSTVGDIKAAYSIPDSALYRILLKYDVPTRKGPPREPRESKSKDMLTNIVELPVTVPMRVTTDVEGFVQTAERESAVRPAGTKLHVWEVRFESAMRVEAATIIEAISEVQKLPMCRRVFNVALRGQP